MQGRADHQAYPITGINRDDVREVLASLKSIDREEWAAAWSVVGERHAASAQAASDQATAREHWRQAWLDYHFGAWPAQNTPGKRADYVKAVGAFRNYGKLLDPPAETVRIPFEGKEIVGYLQLPKGVRPAPMVVSIGGLDEYKEYGLEHGSGFAKAGLGFLSLDMPGTGEAPVKMEVGAERMITAAIDYLPDALRRRSAAARRQWRERRRLLVGARRLYRAATDQGRGRARRADPRIFPGGMAAQIVGHERVSLRPQGSAHVGLWLQGG